MAWTDGVGRQRAEPARDVIMFGGDHPCGCAGHARGAEAGRVPGVRCEIDMEDPAPRRALRRPGCRRHAATPGRGDPRRAVLDEPRKTEEGFL